MHPVAASAASSDDYVASPATTACVCGHIAEAHEHYRRGSDCAICGAATCSTYVAVGDVAPAV
ncbi:MAG: hypothetical protein JWM76_3402 [Pseudonocardiales bacterium]|nr:hypothetical protein [Pseudonocardiales bacterium]